PVRGFPVPLPANQEPSDYQSPGVCDVDGDGSLEIVTVSAEYDQPFDSFIQIVSAQGAIKRTMPLTGGLQPAPILALGDLDCDGFPEIIAQTSDSLHVYKGDGTVFAGWPQTWGPSWYGDSGPVIGDVDGDGSPDV